MCFLICNHIDPKTQHHAFGGGVIDLINVLDSLRNDRWDICEDLGNILFIFLSIKEVAGKDIFLSPLTATREDGQS